ncbi:MAG: GGDEF domain-containing protein [Pseudomonadota bacterium]|nr:GGDEF domain-containing protein [Pseudomonadota bacterium]
MNPPETFDFKGIAKFILLQTVAVLALVAPATWAVSQFFYEYLRIAQSTNPHAVFWFVTVLACAETVAFCPIMVIPISAMMRKLQVAQAQLERAADTDLLTGLLNRRGLEKAAAALFDAAQLRGETVVALICDVDRFKRVNDLYGHDFGDEALRVLAAMLARRFAIAGRWGGEEFLVLIAGPLEEAAEAAEALRAEFAGREILLAGETLRCTLSVGVAAAGAPLELRTLVPSADAALYAAKAAGRDCVVVANPPAEAAARAAA